MKHKKILNVAFLFFFGVVASFAQASGDIFFAAFNADGDNDFAIVTLVDIPAATTIYITDNETDGVIPGGGTVSGLTSGEGSITWSTGANIIKAGTFVNFTDTDDDTNPKFGASIGTITRSGSFIISDSKDGLIAFYGTDSSTPTTYISAIQIGDDNIHLGPFDGDGVTLTNTGLVIGTTITVIDNNASPDGAVYGIGRNFTAPNGYSDFKSSFANKDSWTVLAADGDGETLLNFSVRALTIEANDTSWNGAISTDWNVAGNWSNGILPTINGDVTIQKVANIPVISGTAEVGDLLFFGGASLTVTGTLTSKGRIYIAEGSLIASSGTVIAPEINYNTSLSVDVNSWHLVSSPVIGETIENYRNKNFIATSSNKISLATYNNIAPWVYETTTSTGSFTSGKGYQAKLAPNKGKPTSVFFIGTSIPSTDITTNITTLFNLIGNPYPSYIDGNTFLTNNAAKLTTQTMWFWDEAADSYVTKNLASSFKIAPAQGFFVVGIAAGTVLFTEASQSHEATSTFLKTANDRPEIKLSITDQSISRYTEIFYIESTTTGFDNGYDGELFGGVSNPFAVYTHLVSNSQGKDYQIQSLPDSNYENMIIPLGVNATAGTEITFTADVTNLPTGLEVYLENRTANTFTKLSDNGNYTITLNTDSNGIGQFYLRTSASTLSVDNVILDNVSIYKTSNTSLRVAGLQQGNASIKIVNLLGKQMVHKSFPTNGVSDVSLPKLTTGIYIVQLQTEKGKLNKKIIIE